MICWITAEIRHDGKYFGFVWCIHHSLVRPSEVNCTYTRLYVYELLWLLAFQQTENIVAARYSSILLDLFNKMKWIDKDVKSDQFDWWSPIRRWIWIKRLQPIDKTKLYGFLIMTWPARRPVPKAGWSIRVKLLCLLSGNATKTNNDCLFLVFQSELALDLDIFLDGAFLAPQSSTVICTE